MFKYLLETSAKRLRSLQEHSDSCPACCCAGHDDLLLAAGQSVQPLFEATPEPEKAQPCMGCRPVLRAANATWNGKGKQGKGETTSSYTLSWSGECQLSAAGGAERSEL